MTSATPAHDAAATSPVGSNIRRAAARGAAIGIAVMATAVTSLGLWSGLALPQALLMGAFAAFWGGLGFGAMMGATIAATGDVPTVEPLHTDEARGIATAVPHAPAQEPYR